MAKMGAAKAPEAAPAAAPTSALALRQSSDEAALAALAEAGFEDDDNDGLGELAPKDFRTPAYLYNLKGREAADGTKVQQDVFFDSIDKAIKREINFAMLEIHKSNAYQVFDNKEKRNRTVCSSFDQVTGTMHDGVERPCKGCPDARWHTAEDGKRRSNCSEVWTVFCLDLDDQKVFVLRFKRTSMDSIRNYMQQHHYGKRVVNGKRGNFPAFTYRVHAHLEMDKSGNFAVPVLTKGALFSSADLKVLKETSLGVRETLAERISDAEASTAAVESEGGGDTSFNPEDFEAGRGSKKFVDEE